MDDGTYHLWGHSSDGSFFEYFMERPDGTADGESFDFNLIGDTDWTNWTFTKPDGATGSFDLTEGLSGNDEIRMDGELAGALRWVISGFDFTGKLDITGSRSTDVAPSKLAHDFSIDRWMKNSAMLSPSPMY